MCLVVHAAESLCSIGLVLGAELYKDISIIPSEKSNLDLRAASGISTFECQQEKVVFSAIHISPSSMSTYVCRNQFRPVLSIEGVQPQRFSLAHKAKAFFLLLHYSSPSVSHKNISRTIPTHTQKFRPYAMSTQSPCLLVPQDQHPSHSNRSISAFEVAVSKDPLHGVPTSLFQPQGTLNPLESLFPTSPRLA